VRVNDEVLLAVLGVQVALPKRRCLSVEQTPGRLRRASQIETVCRRLYGKQIL
jgi:hypothetical protein